METFKGNSCLLCLQRTLNLALLLVSISFIDIGAFLYFKTETFGPFQILFFALGSIELMLACFAIWKSTSRFVMACYIYILLLLVCAQAVSSIVAFVLRDDIIQWAEENQSSLDSQAFKHFHELVTENVDLAVYSAITASSAQILCLLTTLCYRASLRKVPQGMETRLLGEEKFSWSNSEIDFSEKRAKRDMADFKDQVRAQYRLNNDNRRIELA